MNERGEVTLFAIASLVSLSGLLLLCVLELDSSFQFMKNRTQLFLCTKEAKGELNLFLRQMGRTNWAIKNVDRAKLIALFIPGLQGAGANAEKLKQALMHFQNLKLMSYLKNLTELKNKNCHLDPSMFMTPFQLGVRGLHRNMDGSADLRSTEWNYLFFKHPYGLRMKVNATGLEKPHPEITYEVSESAVKLFSHSPFAY